MQAIEKNIVVVIESFPCFTNNKSINNDSTMKNNILLSMLKSFFSKQFALLVGLMVVVGVGFGQSSPVIGDYTTTGNATFSSASNWKTYTGATNGWVAATTPPYSQPSTSTATTSADVYFNYSTTPLSTTNNPLILVGQYVSGTNIIPGTYVAAISGGTLSLSQLPSALIPSGTTLTFGWSFTQSVSSGSSTVTQTFTSVAGIQVGQVLSGTNIATNAGIYVTAISGNTVTLSAVPSGTTSGAYTFYSPSICGTFNNAASNPNVVTFAGANINIASNQLVGGTSVGAGSKVLGTPVIAAPTTITTNGSTASGASSINVNSVTGLAPGMVLLGNANITSGTFITAVSATAITISQATTGIIATGTTLSFSTNGTANGSQFGNSSTILLNSAAGLTVGLQVGIITGIQANTYITAISGNTISLSLPTNATIGSTTTLNFYSVSTTVTLSQKTTSARTIQLTVGTFTIPNLYINHNVTMDNNVASNIGNIWVNNGSSYQGGAVSGVTPSATPTFGIGNTTASGSTLQLTCATLNIASGASVATSAGNTNATLVTSNLFICGGEGGNGLVNNGSFNLQQVNNAVTNTTFCGTNTTYNTTINIIGNTCTFNNLTVNLGNTSGNTLTASAPIAVLNAVTASVAQTLTITNGTLNITSASTLTPYGNSAATICASTGGLILNNSSATINTGGGTSTSPITHTVNGTLTITSGTFNVGKTDYSNTATLAVGASPASLTINGGTLNIYGTYSVNASGGTTISSGSLNIPSGGGVTAANVPIFKLGSSGTLSFTGGSININSRNAYSGSTGDIYISTSGTSSVSGTASFNFASGGYITLNSTKDLYKVNITSGTTVIDYGATTISNNLSIDATSVLDANKNTLTVTSTTATGGNSAGKIRIAPSGSGLTSTLAGAYTIEYYNTFAISTTLANSSTTATLDQTNPYYNFAAANTLITATSGTGVAAGTYITGVTLPSITLSVAPSSLSATSQTVTFSFPATTTPTISSVPANNQIVVSSASSLQVGQVIVGNTYYPQGTYIVSMTGTNLTTITLSNNYTTLPSGTNLTFCGLTNNMTLLTSGTYANLVANTYNTQVNVVTTATVTGSLSINNTGNLVIPNTTATTLTLGGTITINSTGGINTTLNSATGTVIFNGGSAQTIPAGTFVSNGNGSVVYGLTSNNTTGVTLNQNITVSNSLSVPATYILKIANGVTLTSNVGYTVAGTLNVGTAVISGTATNGGGSNGTLVVTAGTPNLTNGTLNLYGYYKNQTATAITMSSSALNVYNYAVYEHNMNSGMVPIPSANTNNSNIVWPATSTILFNGQTGATIPVNTGQTFGNVTWDCASQGNNLTLGTGFNTTGTLIVKNTGTLVGAKYLQLTSTDNSSTALSIGNGLTVGGGTYANVNLSGYATATNLVNVAGGVTISTNGTLATSNAVTLSLTGDWSNAGTFTATNTTVNFNGTTGSGGTTQNITTGQTFIKLTISNSNVVIPTTLTVTGLLYIDPGTSNNLSQPVNTTINASGGLTVNSGTFSIAGTTSTLASNTASSNNAVFKLTSGTTILTGTLAIGGYYYNSVATAYTMNSSYGFTVAANGVYEAAANGVTLPTATGTGWNSNSYLYISANLSSNPAITSASQLFGNVIFNPSGLSQNYTYTCFNGGIAGTLYVLNTVSSTYQLRMPSSSSSSSPFTIGNIQVGGSFTINGSTINTSYANLDINSTGSTGYITTGNVTIGTNGTLKSGSTSTINVSGNFSNSGTFTQANTTINFNGSGTSGSPQTITGTSTFNVLNISTGFVSMNAANTTSGLTTISSGATLALGAAFTNTGGITDNGTLQLNASGSVSVAPTYNSGSALVYNNGASAANGVEWSTTNPYSVSILSGTTFTPTGDLTLLGSWANAGTFTANSRKITFGGTAAGVTITNTNGGTETFYGLTINNSTGVALASSVNVTNLLTLTSGILTTTGYTLKLSSAATTSGGSNSAYISGPMTYTLPSNATGGAAPYTFPLGATVSSTATYMGFTIVNPTTGSGTVTFTATANGSGSGSIGSVDGTLSSVSSAYWAVSSANFTSATIQLSSSTLVGSSSVVAGYNGTNFTTLGGSYSAPSVSCTSAAGNGYSSFAVGTLPTFSLGTIVPTSLGFTQANTTGYYGQTITINGFGFLTATTTVSVGGTDISSSITGTTNTAITLTLPTTVATGTGQTLQVSQSGTDLTNNSFSTLGYVSTGSGDWNSTTASAPWLGGFIPASGSTVTINSAVTVNAAVTNAPASVTINSNTGSLTYGASGSLTIGGLTNAGTLSMASGGTLTLSSGASLSNSGTFTTSTSTGTVIFAGSGSLTGTMPTKFYNLSLAGAVTLSGVPTIYGTLTYNSGASLNQTPTYTTNAILYYKNTTATIGTEWGTGSSVGAGVPQYITIDASADGTARTVTSSVANTCINTLTITSGTLLEGANLTFSSGATLSIASGAILDMNTFTLAVGATFTNTGAGTIQTKGTMPSGKTWSSTGTVKYNSTTGFYTIVPGTYNNLDADGGTGVSRNIDAGSGVGTGTFIINGSLITTIALTYNKTTFQFGAGATIPTNVTQTFYNLSFTGASAPVFSTTNGTVNVSNVFNPGTITSIPTSGNTIAFTLPSGGGVQVGSQTIPVFNYNNLSIAGVRGGGSSVTGTTINGSPIVYNTSLNTNLLGGSTVTGTGIPTSTTLTGYSTSTTTTGAFTGVVYSGNAKIITNATGVSISNALTNMYAPVGSQNLYVASVNGGQSGYTGTLTNATNPTITLSSTSGLTAGMTITLTAGTGTVTTGATITSVSGSTITIAGTTTAGSATLSFSGIITLNAAITATGTTSFQFYPAYILSNNATASATVSDIVVNSALTLAFGTIGVAGTFSDTHTGTINTVTNTGNTFNFNGAGQTIPSYTFNNLTNTSSGTTTLGGTVTVSGNLNNASGTLACSSNTLNIAGNFTNSGTFIAGTGTVNFNGTTGSGGATQTITSGLTFNNLTISNSNVTIPTAITVNGLLKTDPGTSNTLTQPANTTINASGGLTVNSGTFTIAGTSGTTVATTPANSNNAVFNLSGGTPTINGTMAIQGYFKTTTTTAFAYGGSYGLSVANYAVYEAGNTSPALPIVTTLVSSNPTWSANSNLYLTNIVGVGPSNISQTFGNVIWNSTVQTGNLTISTGLSSIAGAFIILNTNSGSIRLDNATNTYGSLQIGGSATVNGSTVSATAASLNAGYSVAGATTVSGDVIIGSNGTLAASTAGTSINLSGNWTNNGGTFTQANTTVNFNNTSASQSINGTASSQTFNTFTLGNTGQTLSVGGSTTAITASTLTISSGTFAAPATLTINGSLSNSGTLTAGSVINITGNWANSGTFTSNSGTVNLTGTAQTITGSSSFYNLTKSVASATMLTLAGGQTQTVTGTLTLNGASGQLLTIASSTAPSIASINPTTAVVSYCSIANITNSNSTAVNAAASTNGGNNTNIFFNTYSWTGATSTDYTVATNWTPNRTIVTTADILQFNNGSTNTVSNIPTQTIYQLNVSGSNTTVNLQAGAASNMLTIAGDNNTGTYDLNVAATDSLNLTGTNQLNVRLGTNATADILGNVRLDNAIQVFDATYSTGALINFESGSTCQTGVNFPSANSSANYPFTNTSINDNARVVFKSGSKYYNNGGNSPIGGGGSVQATSFQTGSIYYHQQAGTSNYQLGIFSIASQPRTFGIFVWNNPSTTIGTNGIASTTTFDSIAVLQGSFGSAFNNSTGFTTFNINKGVYIATGARMALGSTTNATVLNFQGSTPQNINGGGNLILGNSSTPSSTNPYTLSINNTSGLVLQDTLTLCSTSLSYSGTGSIDASSSAATLYFTQAASITIPSVYGTTLGNLTTAIGSSNTMSLSGNTTILGNLILNSGILDATASNYTITLGGNFTTTSQSSFNARNGTVNLTGGNQTIVGGNTFYNLSKTIASASPAILTLPSGTPSRTTITNSLTLNGFGPTGLLTLNANVPGTPAYITPPATVSLNYLLVKDNNSLTVLQPTNSGNLGNNTNWYFGAATWTGATDTKWTTASNWSAGILPGSSDSVIIATTTANQLTLDANETIATLIVNAGNTVNGSSYTLTIANNLTNNGTFNGATGTVTFAGTGTVSGTGNVNFNTVNVTSGTTTVGATGTTGNLTFGNTLTINSGATFKYATTSTTFISGNVVNNGTFNGTSSTVNFNGSTILSGSGAYTFNGLAITSSGSLTSTSGTISIGGSYANAGIFIHNGGTLNFNGTSSFSTLTGILTGTSGTSYGAFNNLTFSSTGVWSFGSSADILGNLNNSSTGTIKASTAVTISVGGTWNNSGTFTNTNTTIKFNGTSAQTIPATAFSGLNINNTAGVTLTGNITVAGVLTLSSGILNPSSFTVSVTSTSAGAVTGGSTSSYVNGALTRSVVASTTNVYIFPVGNAGVYLADTITSTTAAGTITITPVASSSGGSADGTTLTSISNNEYWVVNSSVANIITLVTRPTTTTSFGVLGQSATQGGTYASVGGFITSSSIGTSAVPLASGNNYLVVAVASIGAPTITAVTSCITNTNSFYAMDTLTITGTNFQVTSIVTIGGYAASIQGTPTATSIKAVVSASGISNAASNNNTFVVNNSGGTTTYSTANGNAVASFNLGYVTRYDGFWDDGSWNVSLTPSGDTSIWLGRKQPPTSNKVVTVNTVVSLKTTVSSINSFKINAGATVNTSNIGMTFNAGGILTNNGTFNGQTNTVTFSGAGTVNGSTAATFNSLTTNGALALTTRPNINGTLTLNASSSVTGNAPTYGSSSVIAYNVGGSVSPGVEWTAGATSGVGVPYRVNVNNGNTLSLASGTYTVLTLLAAYGNISSSGGSLNLANSAMWFAGSSAQTINIGTAQPNVYSISIANAAGTTLQSNMTITNAISFQNGVLTTSASNLLTIASSVSSGSFKTSSASYINGPLARVKNNTTRDTFPIGLNGVYQPITFAYSSTPASAITVTVTPATSIPGTTPGNVSTVQFGTTSWNITQSATGYNYTLGVGNGGIANTSGGSVVIARREGTGSYAASATTYTSSPYQVYTSASAFSTTNVSNDVFLGQNNIPVSIIGAAVSNRTYNGTTAATISAAGTLTGVLSGDDVTFSAAATFLSKNVGTNVSIVSNYTLTGTKAGAYALSQPTITASITAAALTITANDASKNYGATLLGGAGSTAFTSSGLVNSETIGTITISYNGGGASNALAATYNITPSSPLAGSGGAFLASNYSITFINGTLTVNVGSHGVWIGITSTDYNTTTNWADNLVPSAGDNVIVNTGTTYYPVLSSDATIGSLVYASGTTLGLAGNTLTINDEISGGGTLTASATSSLILNGITGSITFTGANNTLQNLTLNTGATATIGSALKIASGASAGTVTIGSGATLTTGGNLTLLSDSLGTASIAQLQGTLSGTVTVQRYISAKTARKFSLVGSPVTQSIHNAWQQQVYITGAGAGGSVCGSTNSNGFDVTSLNSPSMYTYNASLVNNSRWVSVPNTSSNLAPGTGYLMNIRGNRASGSCADQLASNSPAPPTAVTLSATGTVTTGNLVVNLNAPTTHLFSLVANPYPSTLSFTNIYLGNEGSINNHMWTYSPFGNGNYTAYSSGTIVNGASGYDGSTGDYIASGQAFFVQAADATAGSASVTFEESDKIAGVPPNTLYFGKAIDKMLRVGLKTTNNGNLDEVVVRFRANGANSFNAAVDATSLNTGSQVLAVLKGANRIAIATLPQTISDDTAQLYVKSTTIGTYRLMFSEYAGIDSNVVINFRDKFLQTTLNIRSNQQYDFNITSDTLSQGSNRFEVVFTAVNPLPVCFTGIAAVKTNTGATVKWQVANSTNIASYNVERSTDGNHFVGIANTKATKSNSYAVEDVSLPTNINTLYYRIKAIGTDGIAKYSSVASLSTHNSSLITMMVYPNPVKGKLNITFSNAVNASYDARLATITGNEVVGKLPVSVTDGKCSLDASSLSSGVYIVELTDKLGNKLQQKFVKE